MTDTPSTSDLQEQLVSAAPEERVSLLTDVIRTQASTLLDTTLADDSNFLENGLNSLAALELTKTLMSLTGTEIAMVTIVENPSPAQLAQRLGEELAATDT